MFYRTANLKIKDKDLRLCGKDENKICNCCGTTNCSFRQAAKRLNAVDPNFLYVCVSGLHWDEPNENGDYFEGDKNHFDWEKEVFGYEGELLNKRNGSYVYETWRKKPNLINHDERSVVGHIEDVYHIAEEKSIDKLLAVNRRTQPLLVGDIEKGIVDSVSMGCLVASSICSKCKHIAHDEGEWCDHLKFHKGRLDEDGSKIYEINKGVVGQECSWITMGSAADPKAKEKKIVAEKEEEMVTKINPIAGKRAADAGGSGGAGANSFAAPGGIKSAIAYESDMSVFTGMKKEKGVSGLSPEMQAKLAFLEKIPVDKLIGLVDDKTVKEIMVQTGATEAKEEPSDRDTTAAELEAIDKTVSTTTIAEVADPKKEIESRKATLTDLYKKEKAVQGTNAARRISAEIVRIEDEIKELEKQEPVTATKEDSMDLNALAKMINETVRSAVKDEVKAQLESKEKADNLDDLPKGPKGLIDENKEPQTKPEHEMENLSDLDTDESVKPEKLLPPKEELKKDLQEGTGASPEKATEIVQDIEKIVDKKVEETEKKEKPEKKEFLKPDNLDEGEPPIEDIDIDFEAGEGRKSESRWVIKARKRPIFAVSLRQAFESKDWKKEWGFFSSPKYKEALKQAIKEKGIGKTIKEDFYEVTRYGQVEMPPESPNAPATGAQPAVAPGAVQQQILEKPSTKSSFVKFLANIIAPLISLDTPVFNLEDIVTELQSTFGDTDATSRFKGELEAKVQSLKEQPDDSIPVTPTTTTPVPTGTQPAPSPTPLAQAAHRKAIKAIKKALFEEFQKVKPTISEDEVWLIYSAGDETFKRELLKEQGKTAQLAKEVNALKTSLSNEVALHKRTQATVETLLKERSLRFKARKAIELVEKEIAAGQVDTKETLMAKGEKDERIAERTAQEIFDNEVDSLIALDNKGFTAVSKRVEAMLKSENMTRKASIGKVASVIPDASTEDEPKASIEGEKSTELASVWSTPPKVDENEK